MARAAEGWSLRLDAARGVYYVRFRVHGKRVHRSTGESQTSRARVVAARMYATALAGSAVQSSDSAGSRNATTDAARGHPRPLLAHRPLLARAGPKRGELPLRELLDEWLCIIEPELDAQTLATYRLYARTHWCALFTSLSAIDDAAAAAYVRARLRCVRRNTVKKELSALRRFLRWANDEQLLAGMPRVITPPRSAAGVPYRKGEGRKVRVDLSESEVARVLAALPERSPRGGLPVRAFFTVMYETSLRRETLWQITAPIDYQRGEAVLRIRDDIDKSRFGRVVPLSERARAALDAVSPEVGPIFGRRHFGLSLEKAALLAGLDAHRARHLSYHDFRHAALTHLSARTSNLAGLAYLAGHRHLSTTALYTHPNRQAAEALLVAAAPSGDGEG